MAKRDTIKQGWIKIHHTQAGVFTQEQVVTVVAQTEVMNFKRFTIIYRISFSWAEEFKNC